MSGIKYVEEDLSDHPRCPHGPTLLFSRCINNSGIRRNFFACAACRDRKLCSFFLWEDEKNKYQSKKENCKKKNQKVLSKIDHRKVFVELNQILGMNEKFRTYCITCNVWVLPKNTENHKSHELKIGISDKEISYPSKFLTPLSNDKKEAQYLFTEKTISVIVNILQVNGIKNLLCIGTPRIHESIVSAHPNMNSLLLDFDQRYHNFYGPLQYCWYNLFNHYFFLDSECVLKDFLQNDRGKQFAVIIDPPFGGRSEPIFQTLKKIEELNRKLNSINDDLLILFVFPYFMEQQICNGYFKLKIIDYKVDYDNHELFQGVHGRKNGSPVRIFTNVPLSEIPLPEDEGYRYCDICERWVYEGNTHCNECNACTSKNGQTYVHCKKCTKCVKPTWVHCFKCQRCTLSDHTCNSFIVPDKRSKFRTCFHCNQSGHKPNKCPNINNEFIRTKRKK